MQFIVRQKSCSASHCKIWHAAKRQQDLVVMILDIELGSRILPNLLVHFSKDSIYSIENGFDVARYEFPMISQNLYAEC